MRDRSFFRNHRVTKVVVNISDTCLHVGAILKARSVEVAEKEEDAHDCMVVN